MQALLTWWSGHQRNVVWRDATDPWVILVAEVMSQQTQLDRVNQRLSSFIAQFPTAEALAAASRTQVLAAWSGLGYNRRAVRLQDAAQRIAESGWPRDAKGLQELPGIGPYTAAAVASLAWGEPVPAIDTNHRRVLSRWVGRPIGGTELADFAKFLIPVDKPAAWNQAIMDLANAVCRPEPRCGQCPVTAWCADPTLYVRPTTQPRFVGSTRQARGAILRSLVNRSHSFDSLVETTSLPSGQLSAGLSSLVEEGMVVSDQDQWRISD